MDRIPLSTDVHVMTSLHHGCTHVAEWLDPTINKLIRVTLKQIGIGDAQSLDFHQVNYFTCKLCNRQVRIMRLIDQCYNIVFKIVN